MAKPIRKPLISVIIPVYHVEPYLAQCIESVQKQTYTNIEIILVDDGSSDLSGEICESYAKNDNRIIVIHQKNQGQSVARNVGVSQSHGEFITFVDSDDWVSDSYVKTLYDLLQKYNAQIAICKMQRVNSRSRVQHHPKAVKMKVFNTEEALVQLFYQKRFDSSPCVKLYTSEIVKANPFPQGKIFEDLAVVYRYISMAKTIAWTSRVEYWYFTNIGSTTQSGFSPKILVALEIVDAMLDFVREKFPNKRVIKAANAKKFSVYSYIYRQLPDNVQYEKIENITWEFIANYKLSMFLDGNARPKNRIAAICACFGKNVYKRI